MPVQQRKVRSTAPRVRRAKTTPEPDMDQAVRSRAAGAPRLAEGSEAIHFAVGGHNFTLLVTRAKHAMTVLGFEVEGASPDDRVWSVSDNTTGQDHGRGVVLGSTEGLIGKVRPVKSASLNLTGAKLLEAAQRAWWDTWGLVQESAAAKTARPARPTKVERQAEKERKKQDRAAKLLLKKQQAAVEKQHKKDAAEEKRVAAQLKRDGVLAGRSKLYPSTTWEARFWKAVELLHPELKWDNASRQEQYASIVPLWRAHRWTPEEAAQAVCLRCDVVADPPQGAPVAGKGRFLAVPVRERAQTRGAAIRATLRPDLSDLPRTRAKVPTRSASARSCPPERGECGYQVLGGSCSISAALTVPARGGSAGTERIPARYCLTEISALKSSHQPLRGFRPHPDYPERAQERDYALKAEQAKVLEIAEHYDPALIFNTAPGAIDGLPVVTQSGYVLGGNGRTMATALVYAGKGGISAQQLRAYLIEHATAFGLDEEIVGRFNEPMIVRTIRVPEDPKTLAEWSRRLNTSLSQQLDSTHLAVSRARFLDEATLRELAWAMQESETLSAFLSSPRSRPFVAALQKSDVIDGRSAQAYLTGGLLNDQGRDLVADLLVAVLLPDATLIKGYGRGPVLARAAPYLVMASNKDFDLREPLRKAVRDRITMREQGRDTVVPYLQQRGLFAGAAVEGDARAKLLLYVLTALDASPVKFTKFARQYAELALSNPTGQGALFAAEKISPLEALRLAADQAGVPLPP